MEQDSAGRLTKTVAVRLYQEATLAWMVGRLTPEQTISTITDVSRRCPAFTPPPAIMARIRDSYKPAEPGDWDDTTGSRMARRDAEFRDWPIH